MTEKIIDALEEVLFVNYVRELTDEQAAYEYEVVTELSLVSNGDVQTIEQCGTTVRAIGSGGDYGLSIYVDIDRFHESEVTLSESSNDEKRRVKA